MSTPEEFIKQNEIEVGEAKGIELLSEGPQDRHIQ